MPLRPCIQRRRLLKLGAGAALAHGGLARVLAAAAPPAVITPPAARPLLPSGVMSGDIDARRALLWSRCDRPSRMWVELATRESMRDARRLAGAYALEDSDYTARLDLTDLNPGETYFYRVRFQSLAEPKIFSEPLVGRFSLPAEAPRDLVFAFSGDEGGQGWGINEAWGGYRLYETMRRFEPQVFIHSGDQIYADGPMQSAVTLDDGSLWTNLVTPAKAKVAETLAEFRGNYAYNLLDANKRRFLAEVPMLVQWDDHETRNNWYPGQVLSGQDARYETRSVALLAARAQRALFDFNPIRRDGTDPERLYRRFRLGPLLEIFMLDQRSYRAANSANRQATAGGETDFLGSAQSEWLKQALLESRATWKLIASDMPLSAIVRDLNPDVGPGTFEAWANADDGVPSGRELELAALLGFIKQRAIRNVVWVTADVHYASALYYHPDRARYPGFKPFWEFIAGPIHAGTFGPNALDGSFGPELKFTSVPAGTRPNRPPSDGLQFFGIGRIDARSGVLSVSLHDLEGRTLFAVALPPEA